MIFLQALSRSLSINSIAEHEEQELITTLRTYGTFHVSEIGNGIWFANLECRPCILSPLHATRTSRMEAIRRVEDQVKGVMKVAAVVEPIE